jgi:hypothetical protein
MTDTSNKYEIHWYHRNGRTSTRTFISPTDMRRRLKYLESAEARTQQAAPTDSGCVRFSCRAEADAIRRALRGG